MTIDNQPRPLRVVLSEALQEIQERRRRLDTYQLKLDQEKAAADAVATGLEALLAAHCPSNGHVKLSPQEKNRCAPQPPRSRTQRPGVLSGAIEEALRTSLEPLAREQIATAVGHNGPGLSMALTRGLKSGRWVLTGDVYLLPSKA